MFVIIYVQDQPTIAHLLMVVPLVRTHVGVFSCQILKLI